MLLRSFMKYSGIGGQAVIEGIMMKNGDRYAVGVRKPDGDIEVKTEEYVSFGKKHAWARLPLIRGVVSFAESMYIGMNTLMYSASFFEDDEDSKPSGFELWLEKRFGDRLDSVIMTFSMVLAVVLAIVIFMWLPLVIAGALRQFISNDTVMSLIEGVIRVAIFILYIKLVSRTEDIRRTFMYHGAEHKCINCIEHGLPLTVDNVAVSSKQHKRCGTSFIFLVMIISILFFTGQSRQYLFRNRSVYPAMNRIHSLLTDTKLYRLTHGYTKRGHPTHVLIFLFLSLILQF